LSATPLKKKNPMHASIDATWSNDGLWADGSEMQHNKPMTRDIRQATPVGPAPEITPAPLRQGWVGSGYWGADVPDMHARLPTVKEGTEDSASVYCVMNKGIKLDTAKGPVSTHCVKRNGSLGYELMSPDKCTNAPACGVVAWYGK